MLNFFNSYKDSYKPRESWLKLVSNEKFCNDQEQINITLELMMRRVKENILILRSELPKLGYIFEQERNKNILCDNSTEELCSFVSQFGFLSSSFIKFLEISEYVNLNGYFVKWKDEKKPHLDPLVVYPSDELLSYAKWWVKSDSTIFIDKEKKPYVWFSQDEYTKDKVSGGGGYGVHLTSQNSIDSTLANYGIDISFIDYLRLCFKWAGFPNLHWFQDELKEDKLFQEIKKIGNNLNKF